MTKQEEIVLQFIEKNEARQKSGSEYFTDGLTVAKIPANVGLTSKEVDDALTSLQSLGAVKLVTRSTGVQGVMKDTSFSTEIAKVQSAIATKQSADAQKASDDFETAENARVTADFNRMKALGLIT